MAEVKVFYDREGHALIVWLTDSSQEYANARLATANWRPVRRVAHTACRRTARASHTRFLTLPPPAVAGALQPSRPSCSWILRWIAASRWIPRSSYRRTGASCGRF